MFLEVRGIAGEARTKGYTDQIELEGFCFTGARASAGSPADFDSFTVTKRVDKATPLLLANVVNGKGIPDATVSLTRVSLDGIEQTWRRYGFENLRVTGVHLRMSNDALVEQVTFGWEDAEIGYRAQSKTGTLDTEQVIVIDREFVTFRAPEVPSCSVASPGDGGIYDAFAKFDTFKGEAIDQAHAGWSNADSFCFGAAMGSKGTPTFTTFGLQKRVDTATAPLLNGMAGSKGGILPQMNFAVSRAGAKSITEFFRLDFGDVSMRDYQTGVRGLGVDREWMSFDWMDVELEYRQQNADGSLSAPISFAYDRRALQ